MVVDKGGQLGQRQTCVGRLDPRHGERRWGGIFRDDGDGTSRSGRLRKRGAVGAMATDGNKDHAGSSPA